MAIKCPTCQALVNPINHNKRGDRCPRCWERVYPKAEAEEKPKPASKSRTSAKSRKSGAKS